MKIEIVYNKLIMIKNIYKIAIVLLVLIAPVSQAQEVPEHVREGLENSNSFKEQDLTPWIKDTDGTIKKLYHSGEVKQEWKPNGTINKYSTEGNLASQFKDGVTKVYTKSGRVLSEVREDKIIEYEVDGSIKGILNIDQDGRTDRTFEKGDNSIKVTEGKVEITINTSSKGDIIGGTYEAKFGYEANVSENGIAYIKNGKKVGSFKGFFVNLLSKKFSIEDLERIYKKNIDSLN